MSHYGTKKAKVSMYFTCYFIIKKHIAGLSVLYLLPLYSGNGGGDGLYHARQLDRCMGRQEERVCFTNLQISGRLNVKHYNNAQQLKSKWKTFIRPYNRTH